MYDSFDSDIYFFSSEVTFLLEKKDLNGLIELTKKKHQEELKENIDIQVKRDDLMMWNIVSRAKTIFRIIRSSLFTWIRILCLSSSR